MSENVPMFSEVFSMNEDDLIEELYSMGVERQLISDARMSGFARSRLVLLQGLYVFTLVEAHNA